MVASAVAMVLVVGRYMLRVVGFGVSRHRCRRHDSSLNIVGHNTLRGYTSLLSREPSARLRYSHHNRASIQSNARSTSD
jgi:hypothetical protein